MSRSWRAVFGMAVVIGSLGVLGCDFERLMNDLAKSNEKRSVPPASIPSGATAEVGKGQNTIAIASFNVQVFGQTKLNKPQVMQVLAETIRRFDVVALQELRSKEQDVIPRFLELINADGSRFDYIIGPRLGRTSSTEQYVYLYDSRRIEVLPGSVYTADDPNDKLHREPLVATFRVRNAQDPHPFTFTLINVHTDPDETDQELNALGDVFAAVQRDRIREDDVILLGDLNVDEYHLGRLGQLPNIAWAIAGQATNTRGTATYDNLIFDRRATVEYTGRSGTLNLMQTHRLSMEEALDVSDHLPVWATFSVTEGIRGQTVATQPRPRG